MSIVVERSYAGCVKVRFEHYRRTRLYSRLRNTATGFVIFGAVALACGVYAARSSPMLLVGSMVGVGFGMFFLWFLRRTQKLYEGACLELDEEGLFMAGEGGVRTLKWEQVKSAEVFRLGSRLRIEDREGSLLVFPFSERMRRLTGNLEGTATPRDVIGEMEKYLTVHVDWDWGPGGEEGAGIWKLLDWCLFCFAGFFLLLHMLAGVLMVAPGGRLAQAGLICIALLGILLALRGLVLSQAVTAVGVFRGSSARSMGWFGAVGAALALLLVAVI